MEEAAKDESTIRQNAGNEGSRGLQHIYSTLAKARQAGEDEYGPKIDEIEEFKDTGANNQSGLGDNTGKKGGVSAGDAQSVSKSLTALSLDPTPTLPRSKKDRIEALKQQGLGRRRRDKENVAVSGSGQDTDTESESDNKKHAKRKEKNVLTRMEAVTGPLSLLHKSVSERLKVKVWIRSANCIRGICTGYILAFDTHFNMVMADVDEVYKPAGNPNPRPTKKVRKKRKKRLIKVETMQDIDKDGEEQTRETSMDMSERASGDLRAECQVDGAADSSDSESEANSATTAHSGDSECTSGNEGSSQKPTLKTPEVVHSTEENDSTEGDAEEESDASSDSEEDIEELMARLEKLKHEYEDLKTGETPIKQSTKEIASPSKEGAGATAVVEKRTEESTGRRRSQRLRSQTKPMEVGTSQAEMKTTRSTRRHKRDHVKSPGSTTDSKTASASRDKLERSEDRDGSAPMEKQTSADEKYKSHPRKYEKTGSSHIHPTVKQDKIYPEDTSSTYQKEKEDRTDTGRVDQQKSARLESMISNLKEHEPEQTAEADTPSTDLRTKLRLIRESKARQSKTQTTESDKTPSRKIRSQVAVMEHRRRDYRSSESDSDSEEERESRKWHSSDHERGRDDRYRKRSPQRDIHREPRKGDSKDRDRHKDSDKEREHERRKEHEKRREPERLKEYEEHDRHKKHEQLKGHERAKEYDRQRESERHSHREHEGDKEYKRQKDQDRPHERGKVHEDKREDRRGEGHQRQHEKSKSRESYKDYDKYKESEGYSRKPEHSDQETHRKVHMRDDKHVSFPKDDAHKSHSKVKRSTRFEEDKTSGKADYHKEQKSKGDKTSLSKYLNDYNLAISSKPAIKQKLLPGGHVTPHTGARTMKPSMLEKLRGTSLGDAGLYQRHVKQMMIRGDNVVMVSIVP